LNPNHIGALLAWGSILSKKAQELAKGLKDFFGPEINQSQVTPEVLQSLQLKEPEFQYLDEKV